MILYHKQGGVLQILKVSGYMLSEGCNKRLGYSYIAIVARNLGLIQLILLLTNYVIKALKYIHM